jgi:hypothetical protein
VKRDQGNGVRHGHESSAGLPRVEYFLLWIGVSFLKASFLELLTCYPQLAIISG